MDPAEQLKLEHQNILRGIKYLSYTGKMVLDKTIPTNEIIRLIQFFKGYADDGHHAKEEAILFEMLYQKNPSLQSANSPLDVLLQQHIDGRSLIDQIQQIDRKFPYYVEDYSALLVRHIDIEDELFPNLIEQHFSSAEIIDLQNQFSASDITKDLNGLLKILDQVEISLF